MSADDCWCEHVDIGVGMQKVDHNPLCPVCNEPCAECGQPGCDNPHGTCGSPEPCELSGSRNCDGQHPDSRCPGCGEWGPVHLGGECVR